MSDEKGGERGAGGTFHFAESSDISLFSFPPCTISAKTQRLLHLSFEVLEEAGQLNSYW